ncbi:MAG: DotA/TraY family protein [Gammaproteobacteria bacterium]|nr:DotA/TraY family protein [Gammaproteobacteria bacterium]MBY0545440.1 DotA/TraY family protein [Gammaproteobacteria bacterium]
MMKRLLSIVAMSLFAPAVFASVNFFTPAANDQSLYFLAAIFGDVGNVLHLGGSTLLKYTFYYFNQAVLVLGCIVILYTLIVSTINTSHQGEMMGSKWNSVWIPMRSAIGFALLLPIGTGKTYAVVQAMVMWVIVQGVGAADYLWSNMVEQIVTGGATIQADTASSNSASDTIMSAYEYFVCAMELTEVQDVRDYNTNSNSTSVNHYDDKNGYDHNAPRLTFSSTNQYAAQPNTNFWTFGMANPSGWSVQSICGTITSPASNTDTQSNPALRKYYDNQRDILSLALGATDPSGNSNRANLTDSGSNPIYLPNSDNLVLLEGLSGLTSASNTKSWGHFGGNWLGDFGSQSTIDGRSGAAPLDGAPAKNTKNGRYAGLTYMQPNKKLNGKIVYTQVTLPSLSYLAELTVENVDAGSPVSDPTQSTGTDNSSSGSSVIWRTIGEGAQNRGVKGSLNTAIDTSRKLHTQLGNIDSDDPDALTKRETIDADIANIQNNLSQQSEGSVGTSQINLYVQQQLALVAQAYMDASAANYAAYQNELTEQQNGSKLNSSPEGSEDTESQKTTSDYLLAAAKFNGWASAGALYLDIARVLQATTSDITMTSDYSYSVLACTKGVGLSPEAHSNNMLCKDARAPTDVGGRRDNNSKDKKKKSWGTDLGDAITQAQNNTSQALGYLVSMEDPNDEGKDMTGDNSSACEAMANRSGEVQYGDYQQQCGIYNSVNTNKGFSPASIIKPKFPKMIINPVVWYNYVNQMMVYNFAQTLMPLLEMGQTTVMPNPILTLRKSGIRLLNTSAKLYHVGQNYMWISGLVSYVASNWSPIAGAAFSTFNWAASMATMMVAMMMSMGAILAYYFPMIPYLVFTFATIQWLVLTIEAMTAAPLMALGILHPEGQHEVFGHSSMGIAILSTVFLRPPLMIVGYFASTLMCYVVVLLINAGFFFAANSMLSGDSSAASVFGCLIVWMMYLNTVMIAINKSFSLIYHIPDHVTRWIGITEGHTSDVEQMMTQIKDGVKQGGDLGKSAMDSKASAQAATAGQTFSQRGGKK